MKEMQKVDAIDVNNEMNLNPSKKIVLPVVSLWCSNLVQL